MSKVKVLGTLDFEEASSSDSESDTSQRPISPPMVLLNEGGDDEEIEYFGEKAPIKAPRSVVATEKSNASEESSENATNDSKLASILFQNVQKYEAGVEPPSLQDAFEMNPTNKEVDNSEPNAVSGQTVLLFCF